MENKFPFGMSQPRSFFVVSKLVIDSSKEFKFCLLLKGVVNVMPWEACMGGQ